MREHIVSFAVAVGVLVVSLSTWIVLSSLAGGDNKVEHPMIADAPEPVFEIPEPEPVEDAMEILEPVLEEVPSAKPIRSPEPTPAEPTSGNQVGFADAMASGTLALDQGQHAAAESAFTRAVARGRDNVTALLRLAEAQIYLDKFDAAELQLDTVESIDAAHPELFLLRGRLALASEDFTEADTFFAQAGEVAQLEQAMMAAFFDRRDEAVERFGVLAQVVDTAPTANIFLAAFDEFDLFPDGAKTHLDTLLARAFNTSGFYSLAVAKLDPVLSDQPDFRDAWLLRGYAELGRMDYDEAIDVFRTAYDLDPAKPETLFLLGTAYAQLADYDQAAQFLLLARQNGFAPETQVLQELADAYFAAGEDELAAGTYAELLALDAGEGASDYVRGVYLYLERLADGRAAWSLAAQAMAEHPTDAMSHNLAGWVSVANGYLPEAKSYLDRALELDPNLAGAHLNLGRYHEARGDDDAATSAYRRALALDPNGGVGALASEHIDTLDR